MMSKTDFQEKKNPKTIPPRHEYALKKKRDPIF